MDGDEELVLSSEVEGPKGRLVEAVLRNKLWLALHFIGECVVCRVVECVW
jgi:hypothetical protein